MTLSDSVKCWMTALAALRRFDGSLINYVQHEYKDTFVEIHKKCRYAAYTTSAASVEATELDERNLQRKDDDPEDEAYYLYTTNLSHTVMGVTSAERTVSRVIRHFVAEFGYMSMDVHVIQQKFKSSGDVNISVVVVDAEFRK